MTYISFCLVHGNWPTALFFSVPSQKVHRVTYGFINIMKKRHIKQDLEPHIHKTWPHRLRRGMCVGKHLIHHMFHHIHLNSPRFTKVCLPRN